MLADIILTVVVPFIVACIAGWSVRNTESEHEISGCTVLVLLLYGISLWWFGSWPTALFAWETVGRAVVAVVLFCTVKMIAGTNPDADEKPPRPLFYS